MIQNEINNKIDRAVKGDKKSLEDLLTSIEDMVFNLSLRMLGTLPDAQDASQEIYIRIITGLSSFRKESKFSTWVYRIAINHLLNYKKHMFAQRPLSFEYYVADIEQGFINRQDDRNSSIDSDLLSEELKISCTNVMLQCFDAETRLVYILGTMLKIDSRICAELLEITPEAYRQRLSRARKKMADFLKEYCGLTASGKCNCRKRVDYAIKNKRLDPLNIEYCRLQTASGIVSEEFKAAMEDIDEISLVFYNLPQYRSPKFVKQFLKELLQSNQIQTLLTSE